MLWRLIGRAQPEELAERGAVANAPGDSSLRLDPFEVTGEEHPEVPPRRDSGSPDILRVVLLAQSPSTQSSKSASSRISFSLR